MRIISFSNTFYKHAKKNKIKTFDSMLFLSICKKYIQINKKINLLGEEGLIDKLNLYYNVLNKDPSYLYRKIGVIEFLNNNYDIKNKNKTKSSLPVKEDPNVLFKIVEFNRQLNEKYGLNKNPTSTFRY